MKVISFNNNNKITLSDVFWHFVYSIQPQALTCFASSQRPFPVLRVRLSAADARGGDRQADLNRRELQGTLGGAPSPLSGLGLLSAPEQRAGVHGAQQYQTSGQAIP